MTPCKPFPVTDREVKSAAKMWNTQSIETARRKLEFQRSRCFCYEDDDHEVIVQRPKMIDRHTPAQALVRRKDGEKLEDHWQTLQRIKNEVLGEAWTAYQVFPAADEVIDTANAWHLWGFPFRLFETYTKEQAELLR